MTGTAPQNPEQISFVTTETQFNSKMIKEVIYFIFFEKENKYSLIFSFKTVYIGLLYYS